MEDKPSIEPMDKQMCPEKENKHVFFSNTKSFLYKQNDQHVATAPSRTKGFTSLPTPEANVSKHMRNTTRLAKA